MQSFGVDEYGDKDSFTIRCEKCGREAWIVPTHHYDDVSKEPNKITLECRCVCGNKFGATIHTRR